MKLLGLLFSLTVARYQMSDMQTCLTCLAANNSTCRPVFYDQYSFCCEGSDDKDDRWCDPASTRTVQCNTAAATSILAVFSCPFDRNMCGMDRSVIKLSPEAPSKTLNLKNYQFVANSICYYEIQFDATNFDYKNYVYEARVSFDKVVNTGLSVSNGTSFFEQTTTKSVGFTDGYRFDYDQVEGQKLFIVAQGKSSTLNTD